MTLHKRFQNTLHISKIIVHWTKRTVFYDWNMSKIPVFINPFMKFLGGNLSTIPIYIYMWCFWVDFYQNFEDEKLSEKFSAEMEFCKIDPTNSSLPDALAGAWQVNPYLPPVAFHKLKRLRNKYFRRIRGRLLRQNSVTERTRPDLESILRPWATSSQSYDLELPGVNPTTSSYNASVVKIYSATNSIARFYNKRDFSLT
jgi:hypothetical protein